MCLIVIQGRTEEETSILKVTENKVESLLLYPLGISQVIVGHSICKYSDSVFIFSAGVKGIKAFSSGLKLLPDPYPFLPKDVSYTSTIFDHEGNTWIASLGRGVFFIPVNKTHRYSLSGNLRNSNVVSLGQFASSKTMVAGFEYSNYALLKDENLQEYFIHKTTIGRNRITRQCALNDSALLLGADFGTFLIRETRPAQYEFINGHCIKNLVREGDDSILVAATDGALRLIKNKTGFSTDLFWSTRTTAIAKDQQGRIWLGSTNGLFVLGQDSVKQFSIHAAINKSRITDLLCDSLGNIWVATHQRGIFVISPDSIYTINARTGLPSDICMRFFKETGQTVWVCTNRHISKINFGKNSSGFWFEVTNPGELSDDEEVTVNDLFVDSTHIWVATSTGLLNIEKAGIKSSFPPPVYITSFLTSDSVFTDWQKPELRYFQNHIQIDYVGISYNSGGKMFYKYVIGTSQSDTFFTYNTSLNLSSLAPGNYSLKIWARNIAGVWSSKPAMLTFEIFPPFWKTAWFIFLVLLTVGLGIWAAVRWRIHQIREREAEKTSFNKKISEAELQAVRAQMNEHFIFNSLNSIQTFVNENNTEAANFYLSNFGKLIRKTLDISETPEISLQEEIDYLENYLTLEKMRFSEQFDYSITNRITDVQPDEIIFPSMILQPYVENAIRHGLKHKTDGKGWLNIGFSCENGFIICLIDDNGVGRKKATELKSKNQAAHNSKGIKLSEDRVYLFNRSQDNKIKVEINDKQNTDGSPAGTLVIIHIPLKVEVW